MLSATAVPAGTGASPSPVTLMRPLIAWARMSLPGLSPRGGPFVPKAEAPAYTTCAFAVRMSSYPRPSFSITPGRKLCTTTSVAGEPEGHIPAFR